MQERRRVLRGIWIALLGSVAFYAALPIGIDGAGSPPPSAIPFALGGTAAMLAALSFAIPPLLLRAPLADPAQAAERMGQAKVVQWSLDESIAVLGLVLYLLGAGTTWLWGLCAVASVLMGVHAPREQDPVDSREWVRPDVKIG